MDKVSGWIEGEMRIIDPQAYPENEHPDEAAIQEAALGEALEAQAAAARASQGGISSDR